jgi:hypothetical protein
MPGMTVYIKSERPGLSLFWLDSSNTPVDFTTAGNWSYTTTLEQDGVTSTLDGATVTANPSPTTDSGGFNDVPTLTVSFEAGSLDDLTVGPATLRVAASFGGLDRLGVWHLNVAR